MSIFAVFGFWPIVRSLALSFYVTSGPRDAVFVGLKNYAFLAGDPDFHTALRNTLVFALGSLILQLPAALGLALLLNQPRLRGRALLRLAIFSPYLMGQVFVGVLFSILLLPRYGLINNSLHTLFGFSIDTKWLADPALVMPALLLTAWWMYTGLHTVYLLAGLQAVDRELYEAAAVDGAGSWACFRAVTLPGIRPVLIYVLVISTIGSFQLFELPFILLGNSPGPNNAGLSLVMYLYNTGFVSGDLGYASAVGWTLALGVLAISLLQLKLTGAWREQ